MDPGTVVPVSRDELGSMCVFVAVAHQRLGSYERSLYWNIYDSVPNRYRPLDYAEISVLGTNADQPARVTLDPENPDWHFYLGFDEANTKTLERFVVYTRSGLTLDLTDALIQELGSADIKIDPHGQPRAGIFEGLFSNCPA